MVVAGKKLLVLDVNGLLIDTYYQQDHRPERPHDAKVNRFYVYKRNACEDFVQFCLDNFVVGVWSSAREHNVHSLVEYIFKEAKGQLAFIWHQMHCTDTKLKHPDNKHKPVFLKELSKLWDKFEPDLPWEKGDFGPFNTVLIDDSPYKALRNPPHTAIFPETYKATETDDNFLAGELRKYLEGLVGATDVQVYLKKNPIGVPSLGHGDLHWQFFSTVKDETEFEGRASSEQLPASPEVKQTVIEVSNNAGHSVTALPESDMFARSQLKRGRTKFGSTVEESLEYRAGGHAQSPRDFAERLSKVVDVSENAACERDPLSFGGTNGSVADGILGRPPSHRDAQKYNLRDSQHEGTYDKERVRGKPPPSQRDGQYHGYAQRRDHAESKLSEDHPNSQKRNPVPLGDAQWGRGLDSQQTLYQRSGSTGQWIGSMDPHQWSWGQPVPSDVTLGSRWGGEGEWEGRESEWDTSGPYIKQRNGNANYPGRRSTERSWHSPVHAYVDHDPRDRMQVGFSIQLEDHRKRKWSKESRLPHRGVSPYNVRPREWEMAHKDKIVHRGRARDREFPIRPITRDPESSHRTGGRSFENSHNLRVREHEATHRVGAREHEDFDKSYPRSSHFQHDGFSGGRLKQREDVNFAYGRIPQAYDTDRVRGRCRHHDEPDRGHRKPSQGYDSRPEGFSGRDAYGETYRQNTNAARSFGERSEENYGRSRSMVWKEYDKSHVGPSELHARREDDFQGRSVRSFGRNLERSHRGRNWRKDG